MTKQDIAPSIKTYKNVHKAIILRTMFMQMIKSHSFIDYLMENRSLNKSFDANILWLL